MVSFLIQESLCQPRNHIVIWTIIPKLNLIVYIMTITFSDMMNTGNSRHHGRRPAILDASDMLICGEKI